MMKPLTKQQAVRIAYECARDFRDVAGGCGGVGVPWDDLTAEQKLQAEVDFDTVAQNEATADKKFHNLASQFLKSLVKE